MLAFKLAGFSADDGDNKARSPGRARRNPLKPLRGECRVISGVTVVTNARAFYTTRAAAGAPGARHSLRPLISEGGSFQQTSGASRREIAKLYSNDLYSNVIARSESDEAIHSFFARRNGLLRWRSQ